DEEFRQYLDALQFTGGGRAESLVAGLPLVTGAGVPEAERATILPVPVVVSPKAAVPSTAESPHAVRPSGGQLVTQPDAGTTLGQSPVVIQNSGKVGVRF